VNYSRARYLGLLIGRIGLHRVLEIEQRDPQLDSIRLLDKTVKSPDFYDLIVFNALISYRLRITGEAYWDLFANSVKDGEACETIIEFLKKHRALGINGKIRRLMALKGAGFRVSDLCCQDVLLCCNGEGKGAHQVGYEVAGSRGFTPYKDYQVPRLSVGRSSTQGDGNTAGLGGNFKNSWHPTPKHRFIIMAI
jgi:hypothetical protein